MTIQTPLPDGGTAPYFAFPVKMSDFQFSLDLLPPKAGEHNESVLRELGYDEGTLARLKTDGAL